jgi:asparagine synthase (glutamine-hydrolysing)
MCGIAGAFSFVADGRAVDRAVIERLNERQRRRGPDGVGLWASPDEHVVLGHRRLAIIETRAAGAQPMTDATGRWVITFNGEIYNYRELRLELERRGRMLITNSDTEVLINVVAEWGAAAGCTLSRYGTRSNASCGLCAIFKAPRQRKAHLGSN